MDTIQKIIKSYTSKDHKRIMLKDLDPLVFFIYEECLYLNRSCYKGTVILKFEVFDDVILPCDSLVIDSEVMVYPVEIYGSIPVRYINDGED